MTEHYRQAILGAQRICRDDVVEPIDLFDAVLLGDDLWGTFLRGAGATARRGDTPAATLTSVVFSIDARDAIRDSNAEAARRRHRSVGPGHLAIAALRTESARRAVSDYDTLIERLATALDEVSELFGLSSVQSVTS